MNWTGAFRFAAALGALLLVATRFSSRSFAEHPGCFGIQVVDEATGRGVPLVVLKTVHHKEYVTDSQGWVAVDAPELLHQRVFFSVSSHGYDFPRDRFGFAGARLRVEPGEEATIRIRRINLAERLYRVTGAGIYADSVKLGHATPIRRPLLNAGVCGSDSVVNAVYRGKLYWFWGDTNRLSYPLGNFHVPGAVSDLPESGGLDPLVGINLRYFVDPKTGFAAETARMPGKGPTWINGLTVLTDDEGRSRMFAAFVKVRKPLTIYARGIAEFDDQQHRFRKRVDLPLTAPLFPHGHPLLHRSGETSYVYFCSPYPYVRVRATVSAFLDPAQYEAYTYYQEGATETSARLDRDPQGRLRLGWKRQTLAPTRKREAQLLKTGQLEERERLFQVVDIDTKRPVALHSGSVAWNEFRKRWIMIAVSSLDRSLLGEVWYAESPSLEGPWTLARRIVTHERYSFYNPKHHPMFDQQGGRFIFFEGTYTTAFSGNRHPTPRYNYNQIMYRLDLADPRLTSGFVK